MSAKRKPILRKRSGQSSKILYLFVAVLAVITLIFGIQAIGAAFNPYVGASSSVSNSQKTSSIKDRKIKTTQVKIKAVGDLLYHIPLLTHGKKASQDGTYDFSDQYAYIKDFLSDADITAANFEGSCNPQKAYNGYPLFNTPPQLFYYLKDAGFDVLDTMNNHCLDSGVQGIDSTIDEIHKAGLKQFGTRKEKGKPYLMVKANKINVAFLGYGDSLNGMESLVADEENSSKVSMLNPKQIKLDIKSAKDAGADVVIVWPHWGQEYVEVNSEEYIKLARDMIEWGADAVLGGHPHVVLQDEVYTAKDGRQGYIIHSMGNFISNQNLQTMDNQRTEHGVVVELVFEKDLSSKKVKLSYQKTHPTYMMRTADNFGGYVSQPLLAEAYMQDGAHASEISSEHVKRAQDAYDITTQKLNEDF